MKVLTKYFGEIEADKDEIIRFPSGIIGFEDIKEYILIRFEPEEDMLFCLQSVQEPQLGFVVMSPYAVDPGYNVDIRDCEIEEIETEPNTPAELYSILVVKDDIKQCTANLRCPIVINCDKKLAKQVILNQSEYSLRHPIAK